jgi:isopenicillin N synthase-like dioxygenase
MSIPVIDLAGSPAAVATQIDRACTDTGFFQIVGHGLAPELESQAWDEAGRFFALDLPDKMAVTIPPGGAYGYAPLRAERLAGSLGAQTPPDLKETYSIGPFDRPAEVADDPSAEFVYSPTPWPEALPGLQRAFEPYYHALAELAARVMSLMAVALDLAADYFAPMIDRHTAALRILHYPDLGGAPPEPGQLRAGAHTDYGTLTLLRQDDAPGGLQVLGVDDRWHDVPATPGAYVVNVADALARWTDERWHSTLHRVVMPPLDAGRDCSRRSLAFFHNANWDALIDCVPTCLPAGGRPRHPPISAGRHLMDKFHSAQY